MKSVIYKINRKGTSKHRQRVTDKINRRGSQEGSASMERVIEKINRRGIAGVISKNGESDR